MTIEVRDFAVTIPAGTSIASAFSSDISFPPRIVTQINIRIPPGPRGEVGFAVGTGGINVIPYGSGSWIVTDDEDLEYVLEDTIQSGAWQLLAYNTGSFDHTLRIYFYCDTVPDASSASGGVIPPGSLGGGTGTGGGGTGTGTPTPPVVPPPTTPPPTTPPPPVTPPTIQPPVLLPPSVPLPPGLGPTPVVPVPEDALIGVADLTQVWYLQEDRYEQITDQDTVTALLAAGVVGIPVSTAQHNAILAASLPVIVVDLGEEILSGTFTAYSSKGLAHTVV